LGVSLEGISADGTERDIALLTSRLEEFAEDGLSRANELTDQFRDSVSDMGDAVSQTSNDLQTSADAYSKWNE
jgi:hypothetical protein